jgi:hypothetical protein
MLEGTVVTVAGPAGSGVPPVATLSGTDEKVTGGNAIPASSDATTLESSLPNTHIDGSLHEGEEADHASMPPVSVILRPAAGEWLVTTASEVNSAPFVVHVSAIPANLTSEQFQMAHANSRSHTCWWLKPIVSWACRVAGYAALVYFIALLEGSGVGWIVSYIGRDLLAWLLKQAVNYGCSWVGQQVCQRI